MNKSQVTPGAYKYRLPDWTPDTWAHVWVLSRPEWPRSLVVQFKPDYYPVALADIPHDAMFEPED